MTGWYVVCTKVRAEDQARRHLANQGFETYLPRYRKQRRHARRIDTVFAPLFPGYLFVRLDPARRRWRSINGTIGVRHILSGSDGPYPLPDSVISAIREREDDAGAVRLITGALAPGDRLQVIAGAFADYQGLFLEMADEQRIMVLLDLMGRQVRVKMPVDMVIAAA